MALLASRGLDQAAVGHVRIPAGKGLVGLVAQSRHPINIADAARHPAFSGVRETHEEQYSSWFGGSALASCSACWSRRAGRRASCPTTSRRCW
jgi:signal transduction protein with GAF and PtsI domain